MTGEILGTIVAILARHSPGARLTERPPDEVHLASLGISSVEMITMVVEIEDAFDLEVTEEYIHTLLTVGDVVRAVEARLPRRGGEAPSP